MEKLPYNRILVGIVTHYGEDFKYIKEGDNLHTEWNPYWIDRLRDYEGYFRILLEEDIGAQIGRTGWIVFFKQMSPYNVSFLVDISVNDLDKYPQIVSIIERLIPKEFTLSFFIKPMTFTDDGIPILRD